MTDFSGFRIRGSGHTRYDQLFGGGDKSLFKIMFCGARGLRYSVFLESYISVFPTSQVFRYMVYVLVISVCSV